MVLPTQYQSMKVMLYHMPLRESIWPVETWPTTWWNYSTKSDKTSPHQPKEKSLEILRKNFHTLLWTTKLNWKLTTKALKMTRLMNSQMDKLSLSEARDLDAQNCCSSQCSTERNSMVSTIWLSTLSWNAMLMLEKIYTETSSYQEVPLCSKVLLKDWAKKSPT